MDTHKNTNKPNRHYKFIIWMVFCLCAASAANADQILVQAGGMKLMMEKTEQGISLLSLFDNIAGQELLSPNTPPLFTLELRHMKTRELVTLEADSGWGQGWLDWVQGPGTAPPVPDPFPEALDCDLSFTTGGDSKWEVNVLVKQTSSQCKNAAEFRNRGLFLSILKGIIE